jgi:outer membrane receptor protein involved in Fe transport
MLAPEGPVQPERAMGAAFLTDRWRVSDRLTATLGTRYTYIGFLSSSSHPDAVVELELQGDPHTVLRGSIMTRTLAPGGDLLTLSTVAASPAITWARLDNAQRPSRTLHGNAGVERRFGSTMVGAQLFEERTSDVLATSFSGMTPVVRNAGSLRARGFGVSVGHRVGPLNGSLTYTFGRSRRWGAPFAEAPAGVLEDAGFHDVVAQLDAMVSQTETRFSAYYRLDTMSDFQPGSWRETSTATRFDLQLTQGLPFLQPLTRADWELLLAVRNMFYEASEGAFLDELAVQEPPTRVVGGISVRF